MRVLHVAAGNLYGGVERILETLARHAVPPSRHEFALAFDGRLAEALAAARAHRYALGPVRFSRPWTVWRARHRLRPLTPQFDAVVAHSPWAFALAAPTVRPGGRVLWAHDAFDGRHWTERRAAAFEPALVICNSRYTARAVAAWLPGAHREVVLAPVAPHEAEVGWREDLRRDLRVDAQTTVILIASRLERWKGHADLLRAAAQLTGDWTIWIAGAPQRASETIYERELRSAAGAGALAGRVQFLGERRDMPRVFAAADVLCQPNTAPEPFGVVFVEALQAGLPVVTVNFGGAAEIVTPSCGVLLPPADGAALSAALQALIDDPSRRAGLGAAGPARARALCNPSAQVAALERALQ